MTNPPTDPSVSIYGFYPEVHIAEIYPNFRLNPQLSLIIGYLDLISYNNTLPREVTAAITLY